MMIVALIYGMMPKVPTAQCSRAPPVNVLYRPRTEDPACWCDSKNFASAAPFKPGIRTTASSRQIASTINVNRIRDFSSGILKQLLKVVAMAENILIQKSAVKVSNWIGGNYQGDGY